MPISLAYSGSSAGPELALGVTAICHSAQKATKLDYEIGDTVRHIKFGVGIVTDIVDGGRDYEVTVNFDQAGTKKMFASFAKLKKL